MNATPHRECLIDPRAALLALAALSCSRPADTPPAEPEAPAPIARTANDLRQLLRMREYEAILAAAPPLLESAAERGLLLADRWEIEQAYLLALVHVAPANEAVARWRSDSVEFAEVVPPHFPLLLNIAAQQADPTRELGRRLAEATGPTVASKFGALTKNADLFGHPEGFPKAWLAPDERPDIWESER